VVLIESTVECTEKINYRKISNEEYNTSHTLKKKVKLYIKKLYKHYIFIPEDSKK
jgi:hypothetical protein